MRCGLARDIKGTEMADTKEHWRRRALKAEHELETIHRVRAFEHSQEFNIARVNAALTTAFMEIEGAIAWARDCHKTIGR